MEKGIPTRLSAAEGRKFALTVGGAFLAITALLWWRGRDTPMLVTAALGSILIVAGLIVPGRLGPVYRTWMGLAVLLSKVTTPVFLAVVYFVLITPLGRLMSAIGRHPLPSPARGTSAWATRPSNNRRSALDHQF